MASFVRRAMVYLGLVDDDDEYGDYESYEEPLPEPSPPPRSSVRHLAASEQSQPDQGGGGAVRTLTREEAPTGVGVVTPRPAVVRPITPERSARVHVVAPARFGDAQEIGDRLKANQPVIVNLQGVDRELSRRMIDFCSGVTYALGGSMEKAAEHVFLLTPSNVEVSAEERQRLQERGLYRS
jgi:cell division inhibitor SepF